MAKIVPVPNVNDTDFDPMEQRDFTVTVALNDDDGHQLNIIARDDETEKAVHFKLYRQKFNFETKKWEEDADTLAASEAIAKETFGIGLDELAQTFGSGIKFSAYTNGEQGSFEPRPRYVTFDKIDTPASKQIKKLTGPFDVLPVTESNQPGWARFNFGIQAKIGDDIKKFRVSQIRVEYDDENTPDELVPLKYTNRIIRSFTAAVDNPAVPEDARKTLAVDLAGMLDTARERKIEFLNQKLGIDLEKLLQGEETVQFDSVELQTVGNGGGHYLVGTLVE